MKPNSKTIELPQLKSDERDFALRAVCSTNRNLRFINVIFACCLTVAVFIIYYLASKEVKPDIIGLTSDLRAVPLERLKGELYKPSRIIAWAKEKSEKMYSFTFRSVEGEWPNSLDEFLYPGAKKEWINSLRKQGYINDVMEKNAVMYANVDGEVLFRGTTRNERMGIDVSVVEVPLKVVLDARTSTKERNREFKVVMQLNIGHVGFNNQLYEGLVIGSFKLVGRQ